MSQQEVNVGSAPDAGDGDPLRTAFTKGNENFTELYGTATALGTSVAAKADSVHAHPEYSGTGHDHAALYSGTGHDHASLYSGTGHDHNTLYSGTGHNHDTLYIGTGAPTVTGYALLTAANAAAGRTAIGAGTSSFDGVYGSLSGLPTLGSISPLNTNGTAATYLDGTGGWSIPAGTATGGGAAGATVRYGRVTSISTGTTTTYADVAGLFVGISPNETMQVHAYLMGGCNGTGGSRLTMTIPTGATTKFYVTGNGASATAYTMAICTAGAGDPGVSFWNANNTARIAEIHGVVVNGTTSGTVQVRRRSVVAANITTVDVNSHINGMVH